MIVFGKEMIICHVTNIPCSVLEMMQTCLQHSLFCQVIKVMKNVVNKNHWPWIKMMKNKTFINLIHFICKAPADNKSPYKVFYR